ncbi:MAG: class I SAM-dependent methyltransferase [Bryobacteraceae bacterium]
MTAQMQELEHHEQLYSGEAQALFAKAAVRAFRQHLVARMRRRLHLHRGSRVLSIGCGIGDTEILLAPHVKQIVAVDLSPSGIRQAQHDAARAGLTNTRFLVGSVPGTDVGTGFDAVIAVFFLHHLSELELAAIPELLRTLLTRGGYFYGLDPSRYRLSGAIGNIVVPWLMRKYQTEGERPVDAGELRRLFVAAGFETQTGLYDFVSTPLAGLFPAWESGYRAARLLDNVLVQIPGVRAIGSNVEITARYTQ